MIIQKLRVKNFRSILDETLPCDSLTALVGRNGSGKSSFLSALELFYNASARVTPEDFYSEDMTQDIEIAITFVDLSQEATGFFSAYVNNDSLTVVRIFSNPEQGKSGTYHGMRLQNPDFVSVRDAGGAMDVRRAYNEIRKTTEYSSLPSATSADAVRRELTEWENRNPDECSLQRDDGQFFGFTGVGQGYLGRYTRFIFIPAVRDAQEDATEGRGASVTEIMDLVVRNVLAERPEVANFKQHTQDQYKEVMDPKKLTELDTLADDLSSTLQFYVPETKVLLDWSELVDIPIPMPQARVKLMEDEYESMVERTGHGLQRAFIITMLQHLDAIRRSEPASNDRTREETKIGTRTVDPQLPNLVLAIEEPELYQHPSRQRHLASVLWDFASGTIPGVAESTQVIYATHSPLFIGLDRFDQIRVLRKVSHGDGKPRRTHLTIADMEAVADDLWDASCRQGEKFTSQTLRPRLQALMTPWMNEGFFADIVVLVEGEDDRTAIIGVAKSMHQDFDRLGVAVIPCNGKNNLDRPLVIFRQLGIPVYVVWDGDYNNGGAKLEDNRYLLRLLGKEEQDWPDFVEDFGACFKVNLEKTLSDEIGSDLFERLLSKSKSDFGIPQKAQALKSPVVIQRIVEGAAQCGKTSTSLKGIVDNIIALKNQAEASP